jgi:hypothetical protein
MLTVEEIKAKIPEAEVYALGRNTSHVIVYNRDLCDRELVYGISRMLHQDDVHVIIVGVSGKPGDAIRLLQVKPDIYIEHVPLTEADVARMIEEAAKPRLTNLDKEQH